MSSIKKRNRISNPKRRMKELFKKYNGKCFYCEQRVSTSSQCLRPLGTIDHYIPLSRGGTHSKENLVLACFPCNQDKGNMMPDEFVNKFLKNN